ncbi:hypothetical protein EX30DRAFT_61192 [Ascodesmis nigricans]|uniref:Uncharacterized protein n=1 Tax=Ascodesmis nigricans TaxID=341454 RepID=A0A4S2MUA7_9PEZI|nr:hypothetical protein EX30DRAFT_61192 [Ascodesmis nigricans]
MIRVSLKVTQHFPLAITYNHNHNYSQLTSTSLPSIIHHKTTLKPPPIPASLPFSPPSSPRPRSAPELPPTPHHITYHSIDDPSISAYPISKNNKKKTGHITPHPPRHHICQKKISAVRNYDDICPRITKNADARCNTKQNELGAVSKRNKTGNGVPLK